MRRFILLTIAALLGAHLSAKADPIDELIPVRGLAIEAPSQRGLDNFLKFIEGDLVPAHFNLLILRVDWNYAYESHPELRDENPLTKEDVKRIVAVARILIQDLRQFIGHRIIPMRLKQS